MEEFEKLFGIKLKKIDKMVYDDWLEIFRKIPAQKIMSNKEWLQTNLPVEGFAAANRWIEIIENPTKMDKLYQGRLRAKTKESIANLATGDDDEAFYKALILENVEKLDENRSSAQEVARITQNLNIFRKQLREIRSRKPKKGSVLEKVLELSAKSSDTPQSSKNKPRTRKTKPSKASHKENKVVAEKSSIGLTKAKPTKKSKRTSVKQNNTAEEK